MQTLIKEVINVNAVFRSFNGKNGKLGRDWTHKRIEPLSFEQKNGKIFKIEKIRRSYAARKGNSLHVHFVVYTTDQRYFELVYDSEKIRWILMYEFDDQLLFND